MRYAILFFLMLFSEKPSLAQRLHVLYVLEQDDRAYGLLNLENETLMTQMMETVQWGLGYPMQLTYLTKKNFTGAALRQILNKLKVGSKDVIVVYYSGFGIAGGTNAATFANWQLRDVAQRGLPVSEVEVWLRAKKARLCVIFADCSTQRVRPENRPLAIPAVMTDRRKIVIEKLFREPCGLVKLGGSLPTQLAWAIEGKQGTVFTVALNGAMGGLLHTTDPAQAAAVSWMRLHEATGNLMNMELGSLPFQQQPVLEQQPCRGTVRKAMPPPPDPLANTSLSGQFTVLALTPDSVDLAPLAVPLRSLFQENAEVRISRFVNDDPRNTPRPINEVPVRFTLDAYLAQVRSPIPPIGDASTGPQIVPRLRVISVVGKEMDPANPTRIKQIDIQEDWTMY